MRFSWVYLSCERDLTRRTRRFDSSFSELCHAREQVTARGSEHSQFAFYPSDAMLARVLSMAVCLSVCHKSVFCREGWTDWFGFCHGGFLWSALHCAAKKFRYLQKLYLFLWNFYLNFGLRKLRHGISIAETCHQLNLRKVDAQSVINWTVKLTIPPSSYARPLVYHSDRQTLSTAWLCRAGLLATADTCRFHVETRRPSLEVVPTTSTQNSTNRHKYATY